jgi:hypothetical protein
MSNHYQIIIEGFIDTSWSEWFGGLHIESSKMENGLTITRLSGILLDQAALRGLMNKIWDLNLVVLSLKQELDPDRSHNI